MSLLQIHFDIYLSGMKKDLYIVLFGMSMIWLKQWLLAQYTTVMCVPALLGHVGTLHLETKNSLQNYRF